MKLASTIKSEKGKPLIKTANEIIFITFTKDRQQKFDVMFDGNKLEVLCYFGGNIRTIEYTDNPCGHIGCSKDICGNDVPF